MDSGKHLILIFVASDTSELVIVSDKRDIVGVDRFSQYVFFYMLVSVDVGELRNFLILD